MATNLELYALRNNQQLLERVAVSVAKACRTVAQENVATANHDKRLAWALQAMANPLEEAGQVIWILLAENAGASVAAIQGASDATIDSLVAGLVNALANVLT